MTDPTLNKAVLWAVRMTKIMRHVLWATMLAPTPLMAEQTITPLDTVIITGGQSERRAIETPYAIGVIDATDLRTSGPMVNLSETLNEVPGIVANMRNNYAQDQQISSRGFGARATFGIRGMRLYTDSIPATMPDGQGQVSHFDLADAERIEVLRGPFSALYGANSGGVISLVSAAPVAASFRIDGDVGSNGLWQTRLGIESPLAGGWNIRVLASRFNTDGVRPQSAAQRTLGNLRLGWAGASDTLTLLLNRVDQPAQDPLGLTRAQFDADPYQTTPQAIAFNTRKASNQMQGGLHWRHRFEDAVALREAAVTIYAGQRDATQWQSIPPAAQMNPNQAGGVIDFGRDYSGLDARLTWRWAGIALVAGVSTEAESESRQGYENFVRDGDDLQLGVTGRLRRDESNRIRSSDVYAQAEFELTPTVRATVGLRGGELQFRSDDHYLGNGDDSGSLSYRYKTPAAAVQWLPQSNLNLYVSVGQGFESPTLGELAYRPDDAGGFNTQLQAQTSRQIELGAKWRNPALGMAIDAALFRAQTEDEFSVLSNSGGRSTYQNGGRTGRTGAELGLRWQIDAAWRAAMAVTWLDAIYVDGFETCIAAPCLRRQDRANVPAGNRIAGTMQKSGFASLAWRAPDRTELAMELRLQGDMPVNDLNSDFSPTAMVVALRAGRDFALFGGTLSMLVRLDNVANLAYAGSVIVNEGNGRYFETAAGRNWLLAARWRVPF
ncbi:MAG: TonB-dependent receptor [Burkholderiales bacterium]